MLTRAKRRILFWLSVLIFFALVPATVLYSLGYRLDSNFHLKKTGGFYIASPVSGSEIFINSEFQKRTNLLQSGVFTQNLSPGKYKILVARENYEPWLKELEVFSQKVTEARAILIPRDTNGQIILKGRFSQIKSSPFDPVLLLAEEGTRRNILNWYLPSSGEFLSVKAGAASSSFKKSFDLIRWQEGGAAVKLDGEVFNMNFDLDQRSIESSELAGELPQRSPDEEAALAKRDEAQGSVELAWDTTKKELRARWLKAPTKEGLKDTPLPYYFSAPEEVILRDKNIRNFEFLPKRRDAALVAFDNGIWAIELDGRGRRNITAVYRGKFPDFALLAGDENIYILDDGNLIRASLRAREPS